MATDSAQDARDAVATPAEASAVTSSSLEELLKAVARTPEASRPARAHWEAGALAGEPFVGRFEIIHLIGQGGFGAVYRARDTELGRHVAVKLVQPWRLEQPGTSDRSSLLDLFRHEAEAAAKLNHPNIITIHDFGTHEGVPYLVLELLVGETLARRLERGRLPAEEAVAILVSICRGLAHAHAAGVTHRDLKPGNVFLGNDGQLKLLDFGLARVSETLATGQTTAAQPGGGTPAYMAPEQWRREAEDERTDIFACGVILFEMLCGRLPFEVSERSRSDLAEGVADVGARMVGIADGLVAITERALARDPGARFPNAQGLLDALIRLEQTAEGGGAAQPYRYLEQFSEADGPWFFGREREVVRLEQMLVARPLVALVGPSGAGKSSLVHAGLVPRLERIRRWTVITMRPGAEPLARLHDRLVATCGDEPVARLVAGAGVLAEAPGRAGTLLRLHAAQTGRPILLVVDQLEELVTQDASAHARRAFAQALLASADDPAGSTRVVVAFRDDFLVRLSQVAGLGEPLAANMMLLGPPDADGLADALRRPAQRLGHDYEPGLIDEMVAAAAGEAAPLPLLQLAASRLWERRDGERRLLSRAGLEAAGGVAGILAAHAKEVLHRLSGEGEMALARRLLCDLVTEEGVRRRIRTDELLARDGDAKAARRVLECLISGRLVTSSRGERGEWVELAHESLISGWAQLRDWLDCERDDRRFRERLHAAAALWVEHGRSEDLLWRGETVDEAARWRRRDQGTLGPVDQAFLARCAARHRRARNLRRGLFAVTGVISIAATITSVVMVRANREAARQVQLRELMRAAAGAEDPLVGALILAEFEGQPEPPGGLAAAVHLAAQPIPQAIYRAPGPIVAGGLSPDGRWAAVCFGARGTRRHGDVEVWRVGGSGRPVVLHGHEKPCIDVSFSHDGSRIVTASGDKSARIWRADGAGEAIVLRHPAEVASSWFTPDDAHVFTIAPDDRAARLWRADGQGQPVVFTHQAPVGTAALSPDGSLVLTAGMDGLRLWRLDGAPLAFRAGSALGAQFSPDGTRILSAYEDGELRVWRSDLSDGIVLPGARAPSARAPYEVVLSPSLWSPDGQRIVHGTQRGVGVSRADGTGIVWEIERRGHGRNLLVAFSRDGSRVLTIDEEEIRVWTPDADPEPMVLRGHGVRAAATGAFFSPDGSRILTLSNDGTARVWPLGDPRGACISREPKPVTSLAASPDGRLLLTPSADGAARLWPVGGGAPTVLDGAGQAYAGAFDPAGTRVAVARADGLVVWPVTGGAPLARPIMDGPIVRVAWSPDGVWLAAVRVGSTQGPDSVTLLRADGSAAPVEPWPPVGTIFGISFSPGSSRLAMTAFGFSQIWRTDGTGEPVVLPVMGGPAAPVFHPRGETLMTSSNADRLQFWSLDGRERVALARAGGGPTAWSPDGERVAVGLRDGSVRVTRLDGADVPIVIRAHHDVVTGVAFLPDGRLATSGDRTVRLWLLDWRELVASLRAATTACLTPAQRIASLRESPESARAAWESCERRYGRAP